MKRISFIVNPVSGGKDKSAVLGAIARHLDLNIYQPEILFTAKAGEAADMARRSNADIVVAVGGDGTVNEVASGLIGTEKIFGVVPCGSGDGLALHLGMSRTPSSAIKSINTAAVADMDVAFINDRPFLCTAGFGLDAAVSMKFAGSTSRGLGLYISLAWDEWKHYPLEKYKIEAPGKGIVWSGEAVFVTAANANQWGNMARIAPMASLTDGLLDVIVVNPFKTLEIPDLATRLMVGKTDTSRHFLHFSGQEFTITRSGAGPFHFDGDPCEGGTRFKLSIRPSALRVMVPESNKKKI